MCLPLIANRRSHRCLTPSRLIIHSRANLCGGCMFNNRQGSNSAEDNRHLPISIQHASMCTLRRFRQPFPSSMNGPYTTMWIAWSEGEACQSTVKMEKQYMGGSTSRIGHLSCQVLTRTVRLHCKSPNDNGLPPLKRGGQEMHCPNVNILRCNI